MPYIEDPDYPKRQSYSMTNDTSYTGWIVGGILALVVVLGLFFAFGRTGNETNTAANRPAPTTTGSAVPSPNTSAAPTTTPAPAPAQPAPAR
jgi:hypothetical protein